MQCWINAGNSEKKLFHAISFLLDHQSRLLHFLFDTTFPKLNAPPDAIIKRAKKLCSEDYFLIRLSVNLWCDQGNVSAHELLECEPDTFKRVINTLLILGPQLSDISEFKYSVGN